MQGSNVGTDIDNRLMDMRAGEETEGGMYGKSTLETYITIYKRDSQRRFAVCLRELRQGLCINLEGWGGEGDGRQFHKGGYICTLMADSC